MSTAFLQSPNHGRKRAQIGYGAGNAAQALIWSIPDDNDAMVGAFRGVSRISAVIQSETASQFQDPSRIQKIEPAVVPSADVPSAATGPWKSEARESYSYFVPVPVAVAPPVPPAAAPATAATEPQINYDDVDEDREMVDGGMQTLDTTFLKATVARQAPAKSKEKKILVRKPPFHNYGRGNAKPLNDSDHLASYSLMPLMHRVTDKDIQDAKTSGKHRVFDSALVRVQFDTDAYSGRGLADSAARLAATARGETLHTPALRIVDPEDKEVVTYDIGGGRREVAIQRTAMLLEDSIVKYHTGASTSAHAALDLSLLELKSEKYRALMGFSWGCGTNTTRVDAKGNAVLAYDPEKAKLKRDAVRPQMAFGQSMVKTTPRERPEPPPKGQGQRRTSQDSKRSSSSGYLWSLPSPQQVKGSTSSVGMGAQTLNANGGGTAALSTSALGSPDAHGPARALVQARVPKPRRAGKGLLSRLSPPKGNPGFSSSAAAYRMQWDAGRGEEEGSEGERDGDGGWHGRSSRAAHRSHSTESSIISPRHGRHMHTGMAHARGRPHSADSALQATAHEGEQALGVGFGSLSSSLQNTMRAHEAYDGCAAPLDARLHASARRVAHHRGDGRFVPAELERVAAVTRAALDAEGLAHEIPGAKVVMYAGVPTVVEELKPTRGVPTRDKPGAMVPAVPLPQAQAAAAPAPAISKHATSRHVAPAHSPPASGIRADSSHGRSGPDHGVALPSPSGTHTAAAVGSPQVTPATLPVRKAIAWITAAGGVGGVQSAGIPSNHADAGLEEGMEPSAALALGRPNWPMTDRPWKSNGSPTKSQSAPVAKPSLALTGAAKGGAPGRDSRKSSAGSGAPLTMSAIS